MFNNDCAIDLRSFDSSWYSPGRPVAVQALWFLLGLPLLRCSFLPSSAVRAFLLRLFGAKIGRGVVLKPGVRVKNPWLLAAGDHTWIGEDCWIDNLGAVTLGSNVCLSQRAYLCTGSHDWSDPHFGLIVRPISVADGAWVGAGAILAPGVELGRGAVACAGSVVTRSIPDFEIHAGNPAGFVRIRRVGSGNPSATGGPTGLPDPRK